MASYRVLIKPSAVKELESVGRKTDRRRLADRIASLGADPRPAGCEKLTAQERYRVRQGPYRILYEVDDRAGTVVVVRVAHRKDAYR